MRRKILFCPQYFILSTIILRLPGKPLDWMTPMTAEIFSLKVMTKICFSNLFHLKRRSND